MDCNLESLQTYMDDELDDFARQEIQKHLNSCRSCRQELSRLKLLWLELAGPETVTLPPELPYLRQQVITSTVRKQTREQKDSSGIWDTLEMAWQPFLLGASFMPGAGLIPRLTQTISQGRRKSSSISFSKSLWQFTRKWLKEDKP
jgi:anti-sigma factor RsiW